MLGKKKYTVHYNGCSKSCFLSAKDAYHEGEQVKLVYYFIATDTDYRFSVDGAEYTVDYGSDGYEICFTMPAQEVTVNVSSRNSMMYMPPSGENE